MLTDRTDHQSESIGMYNEGSTYILRANSNQHDQLSTFNIYSASSLNEFHQRVE